MEKKSITDRIKTFDDAYIAIGGTQSPLCTAYNGYHLVCGEEKENVDVLAYLKLRIIAAALNEGWEPQFTPDEYRYYPWFYFYTKEEYEKLNGDEKKRCVLRSGNYSGSGCGFVGVYASNDDSGSYGYFGARLAFKTRELARYAAQQFIDIWADFVSKAKNK